MSGARNEAIQTKFAKHSNSQENGAFALARRWGSLGGAGRMGRPAGSPLNKLADPPPPAEWRPDEIVRRIGEW